MSFAELYLKFLVTAAFERGLFTPEILMASAIVDYYFTIILGCHFLIFTKHIDFCIGFQSCHFPGELFVANHLVPDS